MERHERVRRRLETAVAYECAVERIATGMADYGPTGQVIRALAFEVKSKALLLALNHNYAFRHDLTKGWNCVPPETQMSIVRDAKKRYLGT